MGWWSGAGLDIATAASLHSHDHSSWEHAPELIVVGVGFVAFMGYLHDERRRDASAGSAGDDRDGWRWLTAALLVIAGLGHVPLVQEHLAEAPYMGVLFILFIVCALSLAVAVFRKGGVLEYATAGTLCLLAVGAYVITRLVAFPDLSDDVGAWLEPLGVMCVTTELAVVVVSAIQLQRFTASSPYVGRHTA